MHQFQATEAERFMPAEVVFNFEDGVSPDGTYEVRVSPESDDSFGEISIANFAEFPIKAIPRLVQLLTHIHEAYGSVPDRG
jgi:hypothetical protein